MKLFFKKMKQFYVLCIVLMASVTFAYAQEVSYSCQKQIEKGQFDKVLPKLQKEITKDPNDCEAFYALYRYYFSESNPDYNIREAYNNLEQALRCFSDADEKAQAKLMKHGYMPGLFFADFENITKKGLIIARENNTIEAYEDYLAFYLKATKQQIAEAKSTRNALAYSKAEKENTIEAYQRFITAYPDAVTVNQAQAHIYELAYSEALEANSIQAYKAFATKYPQAPQIPQAKAKIYDMAYTEATVLNTEDAYLNYVRQYPESPMKAKALHQAETIHATQLLASLPENPDTETLKRAILEWNGPAKDTCIVRLRGLYAEQKDIEGLRSIYREYDLPCLSGVKTNDMAVIEAHDKAVREAEEAKRAEEEAKRAAEEAKRAEAERKKQEEQDAIQGICEQMHDEFAYYDYDGMSYSNVYTENNNIILVITADEYYLFGGYNMKTAFQAAGYTEKKFASEMKSKIIKGNTDKSSRQMIATLRKYKYNLIWRIVGYPSGDIVDVKIGYNDWPK